MMKECEYANQNATKEQVEQAIHTAKELMNHQPLPRSNECPFAALVGYQEEATGRNFLLKEIRVFPSFELFDSETRREGYHRLFVVNGSSENSEAGKNQTTSDGEPFLFRAVESFTMEEVEKYLKEHKPTFRKPDDRN